MIIYSNSNPLFEQVKDALDTVLLHDLDEGVYFNSFSTSVEKDNREVYLTLSYEPNIEQIHLILKTINSFEGVGADFMPATYKLTLVRGFVSSTWLTSPTIRLYMK